MAGAGLRRAVAAVAGAAVMAGSLVAGLTGYMPAAAAAPCEVAYGVNQWTGGFTAQVTLTNRSAAVSGWTLTWTFGGDQRITSAWSAEVTQSGTAVTAKNLAWNGSLPTGGTAAFGFQGTFGSANPVPTDFALNGVSCTDGATATPTVTPTSTPTSTPTATSSPGTGCGTATWCDGFEDQAGPAPSGAWQVSYPDCQGTGTVAVDKSLAHTGSTSLRVNGGDGYCNHAFAANTTGVGSTGSLKYVRFYVRHTTALPAGHVAFVTLADANDGGRDLRLGGQNQALQWNRESDDATLPEQSPAGVAQSVPLPTGRWACLEFMLDGAQGLMSTWLDGAEVAGLHLDQTPTADVDRQWLARSGWRPGVTDLKLGWESYGGGTDTLWYDDVAVSGSRIGC